MTLAKTYVDRGVAASDDEAALVERARRGEEVAFAALVRAYETPLYRYICRLQGDPTEAKDLFQETFLRVHLNWKSFRPGSPFKPWLYRIATNLCLDRLRQRNRRGWFSFFGEEHAAEAALPSPRSNPSELAQATEGADRLEAAVATLSTGHRAVFLMARVEGMTYDEIAVALDVPVGTVKSRMYNAVKQLLDATKDLR
nr:RNA polymerase sigma-70 factor ECF subfamily [uncultured bacterium]